MAVNWRVQGNLKVITADIKKDRPKCTIYSVGDASHQSRASDHNPYNWGYGIVVSAIDIMIRGGLTKADGDKIVKALLGRSDIQYIIWQGSIWSATYGWRKRKYNGSDPHRDHVHISAKHTSKADKDTRGCKALRSSVEKPSPPTMPVVKPTPVNVPDFPGELYKGKKGEGVKKLQARLNQRGYDKLVVDGDFGDATLKNVKAFQKFAKIDVDGIVGKVTWGKLWTLKIS